MNIKKIIPKSNPFSIKSLRNFSSVLNEANMPTIDIDKFLNKGQNWESECKLAAECLHETGIMVVRDSVY
jgi:hypothetical protein